MAVSVVQRALVDIDLATGLMSMAALAKLVPNSMDFTEAAGSVHSLVAVMAAIGVLADRYGFTVLEDASP